MIFLLWLMRMWSARNPMLSNPDCLQQYLTLQEYKLELPKFTPFEKTILYFEEKTSGMLIKLNATIWHFIYIYIWFIVCLFVFNKRQNGWTDRAQIFNIFYIFTENIPIKTEKIHEKWSFKISMKEWRLEVKQFKAKFFNKKRGGLRRALEAVYISYVNLETLCFTLN